MSFSQPKVIFLLVLVLQACAINFKNNCCKRFIDYWFLPFTQACYHNPDADLDVPSVIVRHNYTLETHTLITEDGYILNMFRLFSQGQRTTNGTMFLHHGMGTSSASFTSNGNNSLAFRLADLGYDVWLANIRGNTYSKGHVNLTVHDKKYWDMKGDQCILSISDLMGFNSLDKLSHDVSLMLHRVAKVTGKAGSIIYLGHSMGTTVSFMYASAYAKEAQRLLQGIIALAPVAFTSNIRQVGFLSILFTICRALGINALFYQETLWRKLTRHVCSMLPYLCMWVYYLSFGFTNHFPPENLMLFLSGNPSGSSISNYWHLSQMYFSGEISRYDYGTDRNMEVYGQAEPPTYDVGNIKMPVYLFDGLNDAFSANWTSHMLLSKLGSTDKKVTYIPTGGRDGYNHFDYLYAKDVDEFLYPYLFSILREKFAFNNKTDYFYSC